MLQPFYRLLISMAGGCDDGKQLVGVFTLMANFGSKEGVHLRERVMQHIR